MLTVQGTTRRGWPVLRRGGRHRRQQTDDFRCGGRVGADGPSHVG